MYRNFLPCLKFTLLPENDGQPLHIDAHDPGGATNYGITWNTYRNYEKHNSFADFRNMSQTDIQNIYYNLFWLPVHGDVLPVGVDLMVFDFGITSGTSRSIKLLQQALGVADDGIIGPNTISKLKLIQSATQISDCINSLKDKQLKFYQSLDTFKYFGHGWTNRTNARATASIKLIFTSNA